MTELTILWEEGVRAHDRKEKDAELQIAENVNGGLSLTQHR